MTELKSAISQVASVAVVIAIILAAFAGYAVSNLNHQTSNSTVGSVPVTLTEYVLRSVYESYNVVISGTCTNQGGTMFVSMTTTTYIEPTNTTGYFNATITTVSSSTISTQVNTVFENLTTNNITTGCPQYG